MAGGRASFAGVQAEVGPFWLDRYEVTNAEYQAFVNAGGYRDPAWWPGPFQQGGRTLEWSEAMALLRDATGQPGPATWEVGSYREGESRHPVGGVSWYEAAAYCAWAGKELPTAFHWRWAAVGPVDLFSDILWASNLDGSGTVPVGSLPGIARYGAYDMAGNVKEWVWTPADHRRYILGGAWNEPPYVFADVDAWPPLERLPTYGFRCARFDEPPGEVAMGPVQLPAQPEVEPITEEMYQLLRRPYAYDDTPLNVRVERVDDSPVHWRKETVPPDAAYGGERFLVHLYFPRNASPPYQSVLYYPSGAALRLRCSSAFDVSYASFIPRSGRVLVHPVLKGTYERRVETAGRQGVRDVLIQRVKDVGRTLDYLLAREDMDPEGVGYFGLSLGANHGPTVLALEDRFAAGILVGGGLVVVPDIPEVSPANFAPQVRVPTLFINGRHDFMVPYETRQLPLFHLLGTPEPDKALNVFDGGHVPDGRDIIRESNAWLDRYLGPAKR